MNIYQCDKNQVQLEKPSLTEIDLRRMFEVSALKWEDGFNPSPPEVEDTLTSQAIISTVKAQCNVI